jgi:aminoglycoside 6'-N-acetyltransferase I
LEGTMRDGCGAGSAGAGGLSARASKSGDLPCAEVRQAQASDRIALAGMRASLWPEEPLEAHLKEIDDAFSALAASTLPSVTLVALDGEGNPIGFLEAGLRSHADGCDAARPVGYVEGWFVLEAFRGRGVGRQLMSAAEDWARDRGCREMASDALIDNEGSQRAHQALGFEVVDRCVHFRKLL